MPKFKCTVHRLYLYVHFIVKKVTLSFTQLELVKKIKLTHNMQLFLRTCPHTVPSFNQTLSKTPRYRNL